MKNFDIELLTNGKIKMEVSKHAEQRLAQRGIHLKDLELCLAIGDLLGDEELFVSNNAANEAIKNCKKIIKRIERVRNKKFVLAEGCWVTAYAPGKNNMKKMLRKGRDQGLRTS